MSGRQWGVGVTTERRCRLSRLIVEASPGRMIKPEKGLFTLRVEEDESEPAVGRSPLSVMVVALHPYRRAGVRRTAGWLAGWTRDTGQGPAYGVVKAS
jgi:hypothetical protein